MSSLFIRKINVWKNCFRQSRNLHNKHWRKILLGSNLYKRCPHGFDGLWKKGGFHVSAFELSKSRQQGRDTVSSPCFRPDISRASARRQTSHKLARIQVEYLKITLQNRFFSDKFLFFWNLPSSFEQQSEGKSFST